MWACGHPQGQLWLKTISAKKNYSKQMVLISCKQHRSLSLGTWKCWTVDGMIGYCEHKLSPFILEEWLSHWSLHMNISRKDDHWLWLELWVKCHVFSWDPALSSTNFRLLLLAGGISLSNHSSMYLTPLIIIWYDCAPELLQDIWNL